MRREPQYATWLRQYLTIHGETPSADVKAAGAAAGFSEQQIVRASGMIRVQSQRTRTVPPRTTWSLADGPAEMPEHVRAIALRAAKLGQHDLAGMMARMYTTTVRQADVNVVAAVLEQFAHELRERPAATT
ncbi:hypothetical protein SEA_ALLEYCAT_97 [Mycobacterium phage AlleyCat]|uniref:Uncharacterized protein n=2 Tax=Kratiovirus larva TaxID=1056831 RepID=A0A221J7A8_9CAUD|nr:DNA binding protein [Mycobacterium phage Larva]AEL19742.1 hypothetical protein LARVA_96 [Mycobacterium phage Larva]ASM62603.1 hypothetical protein SEA_ALLEYCAT_97 [Mycobacterium phage AlleyCat]WAB09778.1 hypothetical protein SEA_DADOSKY_97 [Mycobacterium phage Dadosky]